MTLDEQLATFRALYNAHERNDLGDDEELQHDLDEPIALASALLKGNQGD